MAHARLVLCASFVVADADLGPYLDRARRSDAAARLADGVRRGWGGVQPGDVAMCREADTFPFAMAAAREDGRLVLRAVVAGSAGPDRAEAARPAGRVSPRPHGGRCPGAGRPAAPPGPRARPPRPL